MNALRFAVPASLVFLSAAALAQSMGAQIPSATTDAPSSFSQLDTNRDGTISPAEAAANARLSSTFLSLDANGNGALEPSEFSRFEVTGATTRGTPGTPPAASSTPPPPTGTPPPMTSTPPPMGSTPPPSSGTPPPR